MRLSLPPITASKDLRSYYVLQGIISRTVWWMFSQWLAPAGRWMIIPTIALLFYGGLSLQLQGYVPLTYITVVWLTALIASWIVKPRVRLRAQFATRVGVDETLPVDVEVERSGGIGELILLPHRLPLHIDSVPDDGIAIPAMARGEKRRLRIGLRCNRRGAHTLRGFRVETDWPFGLIRSRRVFYEETKLLVYPSFTPLRNMLLPVGLRYQPGGVVMASTLGESTEFLGNREYREGDNVRDIDWRATARVLRPIVREYREEYFFRVAVILDTHLPRRASEPRRESFERAVSMAAAVSDYMARQDYLVDLFAAGPNLYHLTAGRSLAYLDQILDILANVEAGEEELFQTIEPELVAHLAQITTVIFVMLDWDQPRRDFVQRVAQQGSGVKVLVCRDAKCTVDPAMDSDLVGAAPIINAAMYKVGMEEL